ncbi:prepilin peptidase [Candidatus Gottesmanbacteria bacterium]|nr:prepilin peptidase [Candidatus Gottesmanbacteria bacterium]
MDLLTLIFIFTLGLCIGSFLNVLIYRLPRSLPITGRSFCPKCQKKISWHDNIPLLSFILLRGRCRHCHSPISWQYPLVELATGIFTIFNFQFSIFNEFSIFQLLFDLLIVYALIVIFFTDLRYEIIPDQIVYPAILISLIYNFLSYFPFTEVFWGYLLTGFGAAGFFLFLYFLTRKKGMGLGDVKLAALMGLFLGFPKIIIALYLAFLTGAVIGVILVLIGKKKFGEQIPFGPFLAGATILSLVLV